MKSGEGIRGVFGGARVPAKLSVGRCDSRARGGTHERQATVIADTDLGLVGVDEDSRMARRAAASVTSDYSMVSPPYRLLMDQFHRGIGVRLLKFSTEYSGLLRPTASPEEQSPSARSAVPPSPLISTAGCWPKSRLD